MNNPNFSQKDLDTIRQIAIQLYQDVSPDGRGQADFRFQVIAEATYVFLKHLNKLKEDE
jgi:hypothetical protein